MPRVARVKSFDSMYHIMIRSISDILLFKKNDDKDKYLKFLKKYQGIFNFKIYAFCLMDSHAHFIIDSAGADISKIMHGINQSYAQYYNRKYQRRGHVFQDRFKSIIISDDEYLINLSAYIHNNPSDIGKYSRCIQKYPYSSLGIFLGIKDDALKLIDRGFILQILSKDIVKARHMYKEMLTNCADFELKDKTEFKNEGSQYRSERVILVRNLKEEEIIEAISKATGIRKASIHIKCSRDTTEFRALAVFFMRCLCNYKEKDICRILGGISQSRVSKLGAMGIELATAKEKYHAIVKELTEGRAVSF